MKRFVIVLLPFLTACVTISTPAPDKRDLLVAFTKPDVQHVILIVLENKNPDAAKAQPFLSTMAREGALLDHYYGVAHPSQPNYIAMISGSFDGVRGDRDVTLDRPHLGDSLTRAGVSWKSYAEGYPGGCSKVSASGRYARKHEPFISFANVQRNDQGMCDRIVNADQFVKDVNSRNLPRFSLYVPDLDDDAHDKPIGYADAWLRKTFESLMRDEEFRRSTLLIVTFDEDDRHFSKTNRVFTVFWGAGVKPGSAPAGVYDHYDLLRTIETIFGLEPLKTSKPARPITGIWQ